MILLFTVFVLLSAIFLEISFVPFPLFFILSIVFFYVHRSVLFLILLLILSLIQDSLRINTVGFTAFSLFVTLFVLELYQQKIALSSPRVTIGIATITAFIYGRFFSYSTNIFVYIVVAVISIYLLERANTFITKRHE